MTRIILAHPYSAALYAYFSDQIGGDWSHIRLAHSLNYYRALYGVDGHVQQRPFIVNRALSGGAKGGRYRVGSK